jgi:hypothetical protein
MASREAGGLILQRSQPFQVLDDVIVSFWMTRLQHRSHGVMVRYRVA